jgi:chromosome segregation ATPase
VDFEQELEELRNLREQFRTKIEQIEDKLETKTRNTEKLRQELQALNASIESGDIPTEESDAAQAVRGIEPAETTDEGNPKRGARGRQIEQAIDVISNDQETFKAAEIFDLIKQADPNVDDSQRAYLYSKLNDLRDDGKLEKVKRGTWRRVDE